MLPRVAHKDLAVADGQAAVATGYPRRVEADLAIRKMRESFYKMSAISGIQFLIPEGVILAR